MTRFRLLSLVLVLCAVALAACGGSHTSRHIVQPKAPTCAPNKSFMGCAAPKTGQVPTFRFTTPPPGKYFPDVSNWQGHPNWVAARPFIVGAAVKAGEYHQDVDFAWNVGQLKALGVRWAPYWFVRNYGCATEGARLVSIVNSVGGLTSGPVVLDMEVPEAAGYAQCLDNAVVRAFDRHAVIYTAPGTWPGGGNAGLPLWEATYGPSFRAVWTPVQAWQFTDGTFGSRVFIPGIGFGDVSVDYGLFALPKPVDPYLIFPTGPFPSKWGRINERLTVEQFDGALQHPVRYKAYLSKVLQPRLHFLANRTAYVALTLHHGWKRDHLGTRYQLLSHRAEKRLG